MSPISFLVKAIYRRRGKWTFGEGEISVEPTREGNALLSGLQTLTQTLDVTGLVASSQKQKDSPDP